MIFYFSGTGNSKYVAQQIAHNLGANLISVSECLKKQQFIFTVSDDEPIGFVFPTYFYGIPTIITDFIEKLQLQNYTNQYTFAIPTCGEDCGDLLNEFRKLLSSKGIQLQGASKVFLPDNYILLFNLLPKEEKRNNLFMEADKQIHTLINQIKNRDLPAARSGVGKYLKTKLFHPIYKYGRKTKHFYITDACNGCKRCEKICPIDAIVIENNKPGWKEEQCVQCLACLHQCPQKAIQHKKRTEKRDRYINPNVKW